MPASADEPTSRSTHSILERITELLSELLEVPVHAGDLDLDADLLNVGAIEIQGRALDSLDLIDLVTALEDEYDISIEKLMQTDDSLTLRRLVALGAR